MTNTIFEINDLSFSYKKRAIYHDANLKLSQPGVYGLVGPNGSGKSTLFNLITNILVPAKGTIKLDDELLTNEKIFTEVSFAQDSSVLYPYLTGRDHVEFVAKQHGTSKSHIDEVCNWLDVDEFIDQKVSSLSLGQKQRLMIVLALLPDAKLLLMDEPLNGLDPDSVIIIRNLLNAFAKSDRIVIVSSHNLDELDKITDQLIFKVGQNLSLEQVDENIEQRYQEIYHKEVKL